MSRSASSVTHIRFRSRKIFNSLSHWRNRKIGSYYMHQYNSVSIKGYTISRAKLYRLQGPENDCNLKKEGIAKHKQPGQNHSTPNRAFAASTSSGPNGAAPGMGSQCSITSTCKSLECTYPYTPSDGTLNPFLQMSNSHQTSSAWARDFVKSIHSTLRNREPKYARSIVSDPDGV